MQIIVAIWKIRTLKDRNSVSEKIVGNILGSHQIYADRIDVLQCQKTKKKVDKTRILSVINQALTGNE